MKREITFSYYAAIIERAKTAATLQIKSVRADLLAHLADAIDASEGITVLAILPSCGKIAFIVKKAMTDSEVTNIVCEAINRVFNADTSVSSAL